MGSRTDWEREKRRCSRNPGCGVSLLLAINATDAQPFGKMVDDHAVKSKPAVGSLGTMQEGASSRQLRIPRAQP